MCSLPRGFCSRSMIIGQYFLAFIPGWYCWLAECYGGDNENIFPVRNVMYIPISCCHPVPSRSNVETTQNPESTMWYHSFAGFIRGRAFCVTAVTEVFLYTFPFTPGTGVLVFITQKLVESWDSLVALTAMKGLKFHLCLECTCIVQLPEAHPCWLFAFSLEMTTISSPETLFCRCFLVGKGSAGGRSASCLMGWPVSAKCSMTPHLEKLQIIVLFCSWQEKTRSNKCVTELRYIPLSSSFCCGYPSVVFP